MEQLNDELPRIILDEYKVTQNLPSGPTVFNEPFNLRNFKKKFRIVVVRNENYEMEFDMIGIHPFLANTFRRLMLSDVPSMAIDKVLISNNTSIIQDEVLAHRLGLVPLKADPRLMEYKTDFYSKHIKWVPIGKQKEKFREIDVGPIDPDILIAKMRPGHELDLKLIAVKSSGKDHAKFSPVATAFYRLLPDIRLVKEVEGEAAYRLQKCFSPGVINVRQEKNGKKRAVVSNSRYDTSSRNVFRYDDLKDCVVMSKVQDHFIFTIESVGAMQPEVIFKEAVTILREKCTSLLDELNS